MDSENSMSDVKDTILSSENNKPIVLNLSFQVDYSKKQEFKNCVISEAITRRELIEEAVKTSLSTKGNTLKEYVIPNYSNNIISSITYFYTICIPVNGGKMLSSEMFNFTCSNSTVKGSAWNPFFIIMNNSIDNNEANSITFEKFKCFISNPINKNIKVDELKIMKFLNQPTNNPIMFINPTIIDRSALSTSSNDELKTVGKLRIAGATHYISLENVANTTTTNIIADLEKKTDDGNGNTVSSKALAVIRILFYSLLPCSIYVPPIFATINYNTGVYTMKNNKNNTNYMEMLFASEILNVKTSSINYLATLDPLINIFKINAEDNKNNSNSKIHEEKIETLGNTFKNHIQNIINGYLLMLRRHIIPSYDKLFNLNIEEINQSNNNNSSVIQDSTTFLTMEEFCNTCSKISKDELLTLCKLIHDITTESTTILIHCYEVMFLKIMHVERQYNSSEELEQANEKNEILLWPDSLIHERMSNKISKNEPNRERIRRYTQGLNSAWKQIIYPINTQTMPILLDASQDLGESETSTPIKSLNDNVNQEIIAHDKKYTLQCKIYEVVRWLEGCNRKIFNVTDTSSMQTDNYNTMIEIIIQKIKKTWNDEQVQKTDTTIIDLMFMYFVYIQIKVGTVVEKISQSKQS